MSSSMLNTAIAVAAGLCCLFPLAAQARPKRVTLPMLEVPDEIAKARQPYRRIDPAALLRSPIELTNEDDRRVAAREAANWRRLSSSLCLGCGETQRIRKVGYVDPIAVLNARTAGWQPTVVAARIVAPIRTHRVQLAHRHRHRSRLAVYLGKWRYAMLKWRRHHHRHTRLVQR